MRIEITDELLGFIKDKFGPCTVMYEALTIEEVEADLLQFLLEGFVDKHGMKPMSKELNLTNLKYWLELRKKVELNDAFPEYPFDRSNLEIKRERIARKDLTRKLGVSIATIIKHVRLQTFEGPRLT